jgi:hypothetical protein
MFINPIPSGLFVIAWPVLSELPAIVAILRWLPVFHQAGCVTSALTEHVLLAHDLAHNRSRNWLSKGGYS